MDAKYQANRSVKITSPLGAGALLFSHMSAEEKVSQPYTLDLSLFSHKEDLDADKVLGKPLTISVSVSSSHTRHFHGIVSEFAQTDYGQRLHEYRAKVRPWFWMLSRTADCRVFQGKTVPDIFKEVCKAYGFTDYELRLGGSYEPWDYCVQYRETDFNFLSRLLEQEGIFYFFLHSSDKHVMVLADDVAKCKSIDGYDSVPYYAPTTTDAQRERDHLTGWAIHKSFQPGKFATREYEVEKTASVHAGTSSISRGHDAAKWEIFDYPAEATTIDSGHLGDIAKIRVQELQVAQMVARGHGNAAGLAAGHQFKLAQYPRKDFNVDYLITATSIELSSDEYSSGRGATGTECSIALEAVNAREAYRPPRVTPKPSIQGTQTAVVVGPAGEEIHTDELGRVKVQFHWDRAGERDDKSSCFVRVASPWAGKNWGAIHIPRIGQEVIVAFEEGDPDFPIIIGSVYNFAQMPPYALPANKTQSGIKSRSSKDATADNFNEIRFEDKKGSEQLFIHAEKNQDIEVENDETHSVGHDRKKDVKNDETTSIGKNRSENVGENETISIGKNRTESVGEKESISVGKDRAVSVGENHSLTVGKDEKVSVSGNRKENVAGSEEVSIAKNRTLDIGQKDTVSIGKELLIDVGSKVTIQTGSASITMKQDGTIVIKGKDISLEGSGKINVKASGSLIMKGSKITQN